MWLPLKFDEYVARDDAQVKSGSTRTSVILGTLLHAKIKPLCAILRAMLHRVAYLLLSRFMKSLRPKLWVTSASFHNVLYVR